jgi:hypothetical protein
MSKTRKYHNDVDGIQRGDVVNLFCPCCGGLGVRYLGFYAGLKRKYACPSCGQVYFTVPDKMYSTRW